MSYLNKEGWAQMATGTWQHHHRHLIKRHGGQPWGGETTVTKQPDCQQKKRSGDQIKEEVEYWPLSLGAQMQSNMWQTTPFPLSPHSNLKSVNRLHTHTHQQTLLFCFLCFIPWHHPCILSSFPSLPLLAGTPLPLFISTSLSPSTAFTLSLTGRAAVDDTYPAESSHAGSMDCSTLRGETVTQPSPLCVFSVCVFLMCMLVYVVHLTDPTAAPMIWLSQYGETVCAFVSSFCF